MTIGHHICATIIVLTFGQINTKKRVQDHHHLKPRSHRIQRLGMYMHIKINKQYFHLLCNAIRN